MIIKRSSTYFFEKPEEVQQDKIRYGLQIHAVLSRIKYANEIAAALEAVVAEGLITETERAPLMKQLDILMTQEQVRDWFSTSWEVRTEVPILLPKGEESRIDRLMVRGKKAVVVDFKTGERNKHDQQQVLNYVNILRDMNFAEVEGYVLYLRELEVINVVHPKVRTSRKKENKDQLGLGF